MTDTKPTEGALRAAQIILGPNTVGFTPDEAARMFDRESGLRELVEAAEKARRALSHINDAPRADPLRYVPTSAYIEAYNALRSALARVKGES